MRTAPSDPFCMFGGIFAHRGMAVRLLVALLASQTTAGLVDWPAYTTGPGAPSSAAAWTSLGNHRFNITVPRASSVSGSDSGSDSVSGSSSGSVSGSGPVSGSGSGPSAGQPAKTVAVTAEWRRSDAGPLAKAVFIRTSTNAPVPCTFVGAPTADAATFSFAPADGVTDYHIYYLPFTTCEYYKGSCRSGAHVTYLPAHTNGSCTVAVDATVPDVTLKAVYQARAPFESFEPMGWPMTELEHAAFISAPAGMLVVPEARERAVRMHSQLPSRWIGTDTKQPSFAASVRPGESFTFQLAVYATKSSVSVTSVAFSDLVASAGGGKIPASASRCMNLGGVDYWGRSFSRKEYTIAKGKVRSLWVAVVVPVDAAIGTYCGTATVAAAGGSPVEVALALTVAGDLLPHGGDDDAMRGTRLHWFDSTLGNEGVTVPAPFTPIEVQHQPDGGGLHIAMLGKNITIGADGLPTSIQVQRTSGAPWKELLDKPVSFAVQGMTPHNPAFTSSSPTNMSVTWTATMHTSEASLLIIGECDCTGYMSFNASLHRTTTGAAAVNLTLPSAQANTHLAMGLGRKGGFLSSFVAASPKSSSMVSWIELDFGQEVTLDGLRLHSHGDAVHDPWHMYLQAAKALGNGGFAWAGDNVTAFAGKVSNGSEPHPSPITQDVSFAAVSGQRWRWVILDCHPSKLTARSHVMIAEVEFHEAGNKQGVFMLNTGTKEKSLVVSSSGDGTPQNPAWQAVDGLIRYKDFKYGYDAVLRSDLPDPPDPPHTQQDSTTWNWEGMTSGTSGNGDNAVWLGSTAGGLRMYLKGEDPLWQAGVPFDSRASPEPPESWYNNKTGGILVSNKGTAVAFSGARSLAAGSQMSFQFSILATPVRPFDFKAHFKDRWAQLGSPGGDYTQYKNASVTVINMHQGNIVNPWINFPYLTNAAMKSASDQVHKLGMKFSVYNTMRELSDRCTELFPMISLNETLVPPPFGAPATNGADWLREHLREGFLAAWSDPISHTVYPGVPNPDPTEGIRLQDAGVRVKALSRWNNYYVAGLKQIMRDYSCDGIYLDEIAYDRVTMLRARKVLGNEGSKYTSARFDLSSHHF